MDSTSRLALDRLRQGHATRSAEIRSAANPPTTTAARVGAAFVPGDRVFDTYTGQTGTVEPSPVLSMSNPTLVYFRTDAGALFAQLPDKLIARPTPPPGRP